MKKKILRSALSTTLGTALLFTLLVIVLMMHFFTEQTCLELEQNLREISISLDRDSDPVDYLSSLARSGFSQRLTLIGSDGEVIYESESDSSQMDNHLGRPEIQQAAREGYGESTRSSPTLREQTYYAALRLEDGSFLRLSETRSSVVSMLLDMLKYILPLLLIVCAVAAVIAVLLTKRIVAPINALNLDAPERNSIYPELQPLLSRMKAQNRSIQEYISTLDAKRLEFETITSNMAEGLILLDTRGCILMMNRSACRIFRTDASEGKSILEICAASDFTRAFQAAMQGRHADAMLEMEGRFYQLHVNPVYDSGHFTGLVALIPDITDHYLAEQNRREFTANISHELKTPLTSIVGYAEIMKGGIAKREDWPELVDCIHREGVRMSRLVEDILHLSRLDNGSLYSDREQIDLLAMAREIAPRFEKAAQAKQVSVKVLGGSAVIEAPRQLADEIIANLIDNAVKYNREGGSVWVETGVSSGHPTLTVRDSGIGIAPEDQSRIFERFFRVDKSRSKDTGGTGLGLSIVKHAVQSLGGSIRLRSNPGEGTEIRVEFPAEG